ncbi:MAG TPA: hypothetical protein VNA27_08390 [Rubrobacteraceae bacterium]|nr:hypothetical protein [Rubrobacteraceae bacterium]
MAEQNVEHQIQVRRVTNVHANWNEEERGEPGKFSLQLILDDGAEEYAIRPPAADTKVILKMLDSAETVSFDLANKVLIPSKIY